MNRRDFAIGFAASVAAGLTGAFAAEATTKFYYDLDSLRTIGRYRGYFYEYSTELARDWSSMYGTTIQMELERGIDDLLEHDSIDYTTWIVRKEKTGFLHYMKRRTFVKQSDHGEVAIHVTNLNKDERITPDRVLEEDFWKIIT